MHINLRPSKINSIERFLFYWNLLETNARRCTHNLIKSCGNGKKRFNHLRRELGINHHYTYHTETI